jgi:hypothetical protein
VDSETQGTVSTPQRLLVATVAGVDKSRRVLVNLPDGAGPVPARFGTHVDALSLRRAVADSARVVLLLVPGEGPSPTTPVIIGLVNEHLPAAPNGEAGVQAPVSAHEARSSTMDARVDGQHVRIVARDEIVLECGKASITLRRNGRVLVKGTHVQTDSDGVNLVRGAQVRIN